MDLKEKIPIMHCAGVEGPSLYINNYRVCGPKPWGGGKVIKEWKDAEKGDILHALGDDFVQAVNAHEALIEALKGLMWRFEDDESDPNSPEETAPDILAARAALQKAGVKG